MEKDIADSVRLELKRITNKSNLETEARLGRFSKDGDFFPGVSEHYFNDMKQTLTRLVPGHRVTQHESIAIYYTGGLRSEAFTTGKIESIQKRKVVADIDMNFDNHYSLRISTSHEKPYNTPMLETMVRKSLKPKNIPKLLREGTLFRFRPDTMIQYRGKNIPASKGFNDLLWRCADPDYIITLSGLRKQTRPTSAVYNQNSMVPMISMAGIVKDTPVSMGFYTVTVPIMSLVPLTTLGFTSSNPPWTPTSWRSKKRTSYHLWDGLSIDMTETVYSKYNIQHCYDGRGRKTYEVEADWDLKSKSVTDFAEVIKHVLYSKA